MIDQHRRARRTIAFAKQIFGGIPATVFRQELRDEFSEGIGVRIEAKERLLLVLTGDTAEASARRVDEDEIGCIEQARAVVDEGVGRGGCMCVGRSYDTPRSKGTQVQPHGRGAGTAIVEKSYGPRAAAAFEISDIEHRSLGGGVLFCFRRVASRR